MRISEWKEERNSPERNISRSNSPLHLAILTRLQVALLAERLLVVVKLVVLLLLLLYWAYSTYADKYQIQKIADF